METVKSVRHSMVNNDWAVSIDLRDAYLHVPIHPPSRKCLWFVYEDQTFQFTALPLRMSLSVDFYQFDGRYSSTSTSTCHLTFSVPRQLAKKKSDWQSTNMSAKILPSNSSGSRFYSKSKEVGINTISELHVHRHGISDTAKFSQGSKGPSRDPNIDYQIHSVMLTSIGMNFPFFFGKLSAAADFVLLGRLHLRPLQMCLLSVCRPHILTVNHPISISGMIRFHLQWWMNTKRFAIGTSIHPPDPNIFLFTDASHY